MKTARIVMIPLVLLASLALYPQTPAPVPAGPPAATAPQDPLKAPIADQAIPADLLQAYKDLSDQYADRGIAVRSLTRQVESWKKRAEAAEAALEAAKKELEAAKGKK